VSVSEEAVTGAFLEPGETPADPFEEAALAERLAEERQARFEAAWKVVREETLGPIVRTLGKDRVAYSSRRGEQEIAMTFHTTDLAGLRMVVAAPESMLGR
jgi:hypothetical protein